MSSNIWSRSGLTNILYHSFVGTGILEVFSVGAIVGFVQAVLAELWFRSRLENK